MNLLQSQSKPQKPEEPGDEDYEKYDDDFDGDTRLPLPEALVAELRYKMAHLDELQETEEGDKVLAVCKDTDEYYRIIE